MADFDFVVVDNSDKVIKATNEQIAKALEMCGLLAEGYAKVSLTDQNAVDTGALRNSVTHQVWKDEMHVGTALEYGIYVEIGTGKYVPGGRKTPWVYVDDEGVEHRTEGMAPRPFIKPSIADHISDYKQVIKDELSI